MYPKASFKSLLTAEDSTVREIGEKVREQAIRKLIFCTDEPHGNDTRITLTTEECHALLASICPDVVYQADLKAYRSAHGINSTYTPRVFSISEAGRVSSRRLASIEHRKQNDF
jgi:hypothetical protein